MGKAMVQKVRVKALWIEMVKYLKRKEAEGVVLMKTRKAV